MMRKDKLLAIFEQQAEGYDAQWEALAQIRDGLYMLVEAVLAELPDDARIRCVGVGTGAELAHLAQRFSGWAASCLAFKAFTGGSHLTQLFRRGISKEISNVQAGDH